FHVAMYIRTSHFHLPADLAKPVIMVGPGTGVAPFRGFVRERAYQAQTAQPKSTAPMRLTLFYGCRHPNQDFLFRDEFTALAAQSAAGETGALQFALVTAFSRHDGAPKVYVQDRLRQHGADVYAQLAQQGGHLYVCGDASRMAQDVMKTVVAIYVQYGGMDEDAARLAVRQLKADGRYAEDTW
ncbi:ferredoxin reductase-like protein, partial [Caulochytrium protostelioides]